MSVLSIALQETPRDQEEAELDFLIRVGKGRGPPQLGLMTFPCISTLVERGTLALHRAYFGVGQELAVRPRPCVKPGQEASAMLRGR